ncbi:MAG: hypothetical protein IJ026_06340 [Candidatus Methanomethylophilaceae archaeon]|nr:hypothetical protein [Candidatus Methanomethylophilaceae archaeon]
MNRNQIIAIAAVIILAVAGAAVVLVTSGDDGPSDMDTTGRLMVYGNATNDDYLDNEDVKCLEDIISSGTWDKEASPLADADQDGSITEADVDMVKRLVNGESMTVYYNGYSGGDPAICKVKYPIVNCVVAGTNPAMILKSIGCQDLVVGYALGTSPDTVYFSDIIANGEAVSDSILKVDEEIFSELGTRTIITQDSASYIKNESTFVLSGADVVRIAASNTQDSLSSAITLGFLMQREESAQAYAKYCDDLLADIEKKLEEVDEKVTSLSVTMSNSVGGTTSDYYDATTRAGSINIADWNTTTQKYEEGAEWIHQYPAQFIIHARTLGYGEIDIQKTWTSNGELFSDTHAYKNGNYYILNGNIPVHLRVAYMAEIFYPDIFGEGYGDKAHQEYVDEFLDNLSGKYDVSEQFVGVISASDVS